MGLQIVDEQVARVVEAYRTQGKQGDEKVGGIAFEKVYIYKVERGEHTEYQLHDADVERYHIACEEPCYKCPQEVDAGYPPGTPHALAVDTHHE